MSQGSSATSTFRLPEKLNMTWPVLSPAPPPVPPVFHRPLPPALRRATATPRPLCFCCRDFAPVLLPPQATGRYPQALSKRELIRAVAAAAVPRSQTSDI